MAFLCYFTARWKVLFTTRPKSIYFRSIMKLFTCEAVPMTFGRARTFSTCDNTYYSIKIQIRWVINWPSTNTEVFIVNASRNSALDACTNKAFAKISFTDSKVLLLYHVGNDTSSMFVQYPWLPLGPPIRSNNYDLNQ